MGITITNSGSHSGGKTYSYIISYGYSRSNSYGVRRVPGKSTPSVDTDTTVRNPTRYVFRVKATGTEKNDLDSLAEEENLVTTLNDGNGGGNKNVRIEDVQIDARPGFLDYPWKITVRFIGTDH